FGRMASLLLDIRGWMTESIAVNRLSLMDASLELETIMLSAIRGWQPETLGELMEKCRVLVTAATGAGYLELWERDAFELSGLPQGQDRLNFREIRLRSEQMRRVVDWGVGMIRSYYQPEIDTFSRFEPLVHGAVDDRIRSSVLLSLGDAAGRLTEVLTAETGWTHRLPDGIKPHGVRGLNSGLAYGPLEVVDDPSGPAVTDAKTIYAFTTVPAELKPVAGILAVSEGNLVSHVQLLARNLGIPNAAVTPDTLAALREYSGRPFFFAVSAKGGVVLKPDGVLSPQERDLVRNRRRQPERFSVPVEKIDLSRTAPVTLSRLRATDSGRLCGPKAANLGELKYLFPAYVGEGIVLPFGLFREHMEQPMPGQNSSYWDFLVRSLAVPGENEAERLKALSQLRDAIRKMPLLPGFESGLDELFRTELGGMMGTVPVFIRSDTNMEDISEFTGAGLNLTVFNVRDRKALLQGIRDVWASPYSERSYLWRQKYLSNPENVYPSVLLLPTVNVERSGVVITHGIASDQPEDITAAFSLGAGGAVEGQTSETYLMRAGGRDLLLTPSRERWHIRLPPEGGSAKVRSLLHRPVLSGDDLLKIRNLVAEVRRILPGTPGIEGHGPFDIEMGFLADEIRLFQVRPFMENRRAARMNYLQEMDRQHTAPETLSLNRRIDP
ncbi:MAG TPA: phosphoenolpyruvate synthase, partial [Desulfobacteraceae bacterium]|nr:phosphoenolpyruvate synthase [Desulfobacteraceae bacterium]